MRSQVSAELLIVIAALAALAVYVFNSMQASSKRLAKRYESAEKNMEKIIDELMRS